MSSSQALGELGLPPFYFLKSWDQFPDFLAQMKEKIQNNPQEIQKMQDDCIAWWSTYKVHIAQKIQRKIESLN